MADPTSIIGLYYWLKADDKVYQDLTKLVACTNGTSVACWADQNGLVDFTNPTTANRPIYLINQINGLPAIKFNNGSTTQCLGGNHSTNQPYTVAMVFNAYYIYPGNYNILFQGNSSSPQLVWPNAWTIGGGIGKVTYIGCGAQLFMDASIRINAYNMVVTTFNGTSTYVRVNGSYYSSGSSAGTNACVNMRIGDDVLAGGSQPLGLLASEFAFYTKSLSVIEAQTLETYFTTRYGITNASIISASRSPTATQCVNGYVQGISLGGPTSIHGDAPMGRHLQIGVTQSLTEGFLNPPSLQLDIPGFWRFRWVVKAGPRAIYVSAKQNSTGSIYRPSVKVKKNSAVGLATDLTASAAAGGDWQQIPIAFTATGNDVVWVELWNNNTNAFNTPAFFDHIITT